MRHSGILNCHSKKMIVCSTSCMKIFMCLICFSCVIFGVLRLLHEIHAINGNKGTSRTIMVRQMHHFQQDDEHLISVLRESLIQPSAEPYMLKNPLPAKEHVLEREVRQLNHLKRGFFVEVGAGDGETRSPTLCLESEDGWSGLLIEADPVTAGQLRVKQRKAILVNGCVGVTNFSYVAHLWKSRVMPPEWEAPGGPEPVEVTCYPLYTYLAAADRATVDFLVVNTDGGELDILRTLPWNLVPVMIVSVKYNNTNEKLETTTFMRGVGYVLRNNFSHFGESFNMFIRK